MQFILWRSIKQKLVIVSLNQMKIIVLHEVNSLAEIIDVSYHKRLPMYYLINYVDHAICITRDFEKTYDIHIKQDFFSDNFEDLFSTLIIYIYDIGETRFVGRRRLWKTLTESGIIVGEWCYHQDDDYSCIACSTYTNRTYKGANLIIYIGKKYPLQWYKNWNSFGKIKMWITLGGLQGLTSRQKKSHSSNTEFPNPHNFEHYSH